MVEKHNYPKKSENLWTVKLEFKGKKTWHGTHFINGIKIGAE